MTIQPTGHAGYGPGDTQTFAGARVVEAPATSGEAFDQTLAALARARAAIGGVIFGQQAVIDQALVTILAGGHGLFVGLPGLAKTRLVDALGVVLGMETRRVQFTPDLMPSDILGSEILDEDEHGRRSFRFVRGPVFAQLLMADEINRASPRTQSALLQAMQERHVTVAGERHDLPAPFHVLATQNPIEQEGAYPLPEAQLDRFLLQIDVPYPDRDAERRILLETTGNCRWASRWLRLSSTWCAPPAPTAATPESPAICPGGQVPAPARR